ncbi:hypothetical protein [Marinoscillum furvescens]|uniref:Uncharacterized protein n=1 Tax=Marinoscillum furvescens DSM 4134 TaxID=1122208 RepID=A0A3D9KVR1_MARFU|nr:hypothetical protein [Marinoscillum furvescens]RED91305.1 hypothetical protein C7460_1493 [Marinoscillum furvescens DSM 4134]
MKPTLLTAILLWVLGSCSQQVQEQNSVYLQVNQKLLSEEVYTSEGFLFKKPKNWVSVNESQSGPPVFMNPVDSSFMLLSVPTPDLSSFNGPQSSEFVQNSIHFSQDVYQNETMVFFAVRMKNEIDSTGVIYVVPRASVDQLAPVIESSIGSIEPARG